MRVNIDSKKISSSSELVVEIDNLEDNLEKSIKQLKQQLMYGNNSCFLVSGYRGTGKTTLVHTLEKEINDGNIMFVYLNFAKYESYSLILRKLIRETYLTFVNNENYASIKGKNKDLITNIKLLYDHTFFEIYNNLNVKNSKETNNKLEINLNLKDLIKHVFPLLAFVFSIFNIKYNILNIALENINWVLLVFSLIWTVFDCGSLYEKVKKREWVEELNRRSLYDDEIAEFHLKNILSKINEENIKTVYVLDELDKIENEEEMEKIISDLKPILVSNLASFIVISGQKLYYKYIKSNVLDDSIISSIFSKNVHVPLKSNKELEKLFYSFANNKNDKNNIECNLVKNYINSLILNSNRIVRKFINLILQDITWENGITYITINEDNKDEYETDSILLSILNEIVENDVDNTEFDIGIRDFLTYQLFVWIKKMKLKVNEEFTLDEVYNFEGNYTNIYPSWCKYQLNVLCNNLINNLINEGLLEQRVEPVEEDEIIYYKWTNSVAIKTEGNTNEINKLKALIFDKVIEFEKYCRDIYIDLNKSKQNLKNSELRTLVTNLNSSGILGDKWINDEREYLYILRNKIVHGEQLDLYETDMLPRYINIIPKYIYDLIEEYSYYVVNRYFRKYEYFTINTKGRIDSYKFDFIAENMELDKCNIIFEIKYRNNYSPNDLRIIRNMIKNLIEYNKFSQKKNKLVVFWFSKENSRHYEKFKDTFTNIINKEYKDLVGYIYLFECLTTFNSSKIEEYLNIVMNEDEFVSNIALTDI